MEENQNPTSQTVIPDQIGNPEPSNPVRPKSKFPLAIIIGIILFLLIAGSAAGFYVFKPQILKLVSKPTPTPTPTVPVSLTSTPDPTAGWKIFKGNYISFKYPNLSEVSLSTNPLVMQFINIYINPPQETDLRSEYIPHFISMVIYKNENKDMNPSKILATNPFDKRIIETIKIDKNNIEQLSIDGLEGFRIKNPPGLTDFWGEKKTLAYVSKNNIIYHFYIDSSVGTLADQILSTIKFTDSKTIDILNWKTYESTNKQFSFKYPQTYKLTEDASTPALYIDVKNSQEGYRFTISSPTIKFDPPVTPTGSHPDNLSWTVHPPTLYSDAGNQGTKNMYYEINNSGTKVQFTSLSKTIDSNLMNQILSTFQFKN